MKAITTLNTEKEVSLNYASSMTSGYGHKLISVELECNGEYREFSHTTNNMLDFDRASDLEGDEKYLALFNLIESDIEDEVIEWLSELN